MPLNLTDVVRYVEENIDDFHSRRIAGVNKLVLKKVLSKKNLYLFKAKHLLLSQDIVKSFTDAFISSQEETIFGNWLEGLVIFINQEVYGGRKSGIKGIDLEFDLGKIRNLVVIKSGPSWGNSSQISKMVTNFKEAQKALRTSNSKINIRAINGCCYGRDNNPDKGDFYKFCGQRFWEFISGDAELYLNIIEPLGHQASARNDEFQKGYAQIINKFTEEFSAEFVKANGAINWKKLIQFNSGIDGPDTEVDPDIEAADIVQSE